MQWKKQLHDRSSCLLAFQIQWLRLSDFGLFVSFLFFQHSYFSWLSLLYMHIYHKDFQFDWYYLLDFKEQENRVKKNCKINWLFLNECLVFIWANPILELNVAIVSSGLVSYKSLDSMRILVHEREVYVNVKGRIVRRNRTVSRVSLTLRDWLIYLWKSFAFISGLLYHVSVFEGATLKNLSLQNHKLFSRLWFKNSCFQAIFFLNFRNEILIYIRDKNQYLYRIFI